MSDLSGDADVNWQLCDRPSRGAAEELFWRFAHSIVHSDVQVW